MQGYTHTGPIDCNKPFDVGNLKGKTAIVTGGMALIISQLNGHLMTIKQVPMVLERLMFALWWLQGMIYKHAAITKKTCIG